MTHVYVLMEEDYGGMFSSPMVPTGVALTNEEAAQKWVEEKRYVRCYKKVRVDD